MVQSGVPDLTRVGLLDQGVCDPDDDGHEGFTGGQAGDSCLHPCLGRARGHGPTEQQRSRAVKQVSAVHPALPIGMAYPVTVPGSICNEGTKAYVAVAGRENDAVLLTETRKLSNSERKCL